MVTKTKSILGYTNRCFRAFGIFGVMLVRAFCGVSVGVCVCVFVAIFACGCLDASARFSRDGWI